MEVENKNTFKTTLEWAELFKKDILSGASIIDIINHLNNYYADMLTLNPDPEKRWHKLPKKSDIIANGIDKDGNTTNDGVKVCIAGVPISKKTINSTIEPQKD